MKKMPFLLLLLIIVSLPLGFRNASGLESINVEYDPTPTESNPFTGFVPFIGEFMEPDDFPHSMEFFYVPLKDLMNDSSSFTFETGLEPNLEKINGRNHQAIFRVYLDYPGAPTGIPDFLLDGLTLNSYADYGGGQSPDYTNETLISTLETFIGELGTQYDGDTRIAFIQIGLLGFWGEWHTYPHESWFPDTTTQNRILHAFDNAFNTTQILLRYPTADSPTLDMGFHDDSFAYETIGTDNWVFYNLLVDASAQNRWQEFPIGGEIYPDIQTTMWELFPPSEVQDYGLCVESTHASWMIYDEIFYGSFTSGEKNRARDGALLLGYQFAVTGISSQRDQNILLVNVTIENKGNAPFYYPLSIQYGIRSTNSGEFTPVGALEVLDSLPDEKTSFLIEFDLDVFDADTFDVNIRLDSPMSEIPIFLANEDCLSDGSLIVASTFPQDKIPWNTAGFIIGVITISSIIAISILHKQKNKK